MRFLMLIFDCLCFCETLDLPLEFVGELVLEDRMLHEREPLSCDSRGDD